MRATTPIAIMVERMLAAGVAAEAVVAAVEAQESVQPETAVSFKAACFIRRRLGKAWSAIVGGMATDP